MKKPHIVKKWARPGIDHFSSRVCPNTSSNWVVMRLPRLSLRLFSVLVGAPERISLVSHRTRLAANTQHERRQPETDDEPDHHLGIHRAPPA